MERIENPMANHDHSDDPQARIIAGRAKAIQDNQKKLERLEEELSEILETIKDKLYLDLDIVDDIRNTYQRKILNTRIELADLIEAAERCKNG